MASSQDLGAKLDALIRLTGLLVIGERTGSEAITVLARAGLDNGVIAELVGTSVATVRATRSRARRQRGKE